MRALLFILALLAAVLPAQAENPLAQFRKAALPVVNVHGERLVLHVEVAETPATRAQGLMFRQQLKPGHGMLLLWRAPRRVGIWMKNTLIPLDIIFIDAEQRIARVHEGARPHDLTVIPSRVPVLAVLEVSAGEARRLGLLPGARVRLPLPATR